MKLQPQSENYNTKSPLIKFVEDKSRTFGRVRDILNLKQPCSLSNSRRRGSRRVSCSHDKRRCWRWFLKAFTCSNLSLRPNLTLTLTFLNHYPTLFTHPWRTVFPKTKFVTFTIVIYDNKHDNKLSFRVVSVFNCVTGLLSNCVCVRKF